MQILLGCGSNLTKKVRANGEKSEWDNLVTLDFNAEHNPNIVWDLRKLPLPFDDESADELHLYDVLEHTGQQGDFEFFFNQWSDFYRILKPGGKVYGISPSPVSDFLWADPGHSRVVSPQSFVFLHQPSYTAQVGKTSMTDYRFIYKADFEPVHLEIGPDKNFIYVLKAVKPSRYGNGSQAGE